MPLRTIRDLHRDDRGGVTMITAGSLVAFMGMLALSVDVGSVYLETRRLQGVADLAALAAVSVSSNGRAAADGSIAASGWSRPYTLAYSSGTYSPNPAVAPSARYTPGTGTNAARVSVTSTAKLYFATALVGRNQAQITRTATATRVNSAAFTIGTRLAALNGGIVNSLLSALTGTTLSLSVADSNALLGAHVDALQFIDALRLRLNLQAATFNDVIAARATMPQLLTALSDALTRGGNPSAARVVGTIALQAGSVASIRLNDIINLGTSGNTDREAPGAQVIVNLFDMLRTMLEVANGGRQIQLNLGAQIPGILDTTVWVATGQRSTTSPWLTVTDSDQVIVRTAQSRIYLRTRVGASSALAALGVTGLNVPLYAEIAQSSAKLSSITCSRAAGSSVALDVLPSVGHVSIADINTANIANFTTALPESPTTLVGLALVNINGQARVDLGGATWQRTNFTPTDISTGAVHTVSTRDLTAGIAASLVQNTTLTVVLLGLPLNLSVLTSLIGAQLQLLAPTLDGLLGSVTDLLGVHVGQADVNVAGVRCGVPALVA